MRLEGHVARVVDTKNMQQTFVNRYPLGFIKTENFLIVSITPVSYHLWYVSHTFMTQLKQATHTAFKHHNARHCNTCPCTCRF